MRLLPTAALLLLLAAPLRAQAPAEKVPARWAPDQGLVVGQLAGTWAMGLSTMGGKGVETGLAITGGRGGEAALVRGVTLFTRGEGNVSLNGAWVEVGGAEARFPIRRKLEAKAGQVTVLGLMFFQKDPSTREGYRIVAFDNRDETMDFLRRTWPALVAGHDSAAVVLAPGDYQPMTKLVELRTAYAQREARASKRQGQFWVAAPAGTIAEVAVAGDSVRVLRFLPPVTYHEPVTNAWDAAGTLTFASMTHRWRVVDGKVEGVGP